MFFPNTLTDILIAVLIAVFIVVGVYLVLILMRMLSVMNRFDKIVSYADRIGAVLQSFEAVPLAIVSVIRQVAVRFLDRGNHKAKKKSSSD
jgi:uncharacterized membrane protein